MKRNPPGPSRARYGRLLLLLVLFAGTALPLQAQRRLQQKVTITFAAQPLSKSLQQVQEQTGVSIAFTQADVQPYQTAASNFKDAPLQTVLQSLVKNTPLVYSEKGNYIVISIKKEERQQSTPGAIAGVIRDQETGEGLPGVTVLVKNTNRGASSLSDGNYSVSAAPGDTLVFTYMGYEQLQVPVGEQSAIPVRLRQTAGALGEVVVLGFGQKQAKIAQTGAIASITTKDIKQSPVANIANALTGRLPGLVTVQRSGEPGMDMPELYIRGQATSNSSAPLITIDGVQKESIAISLLDPNEVESITILKDASATALYGVKGANGVIIIKTRRGTEGKARVSTGVQTSVQTPTKLPKYLDSYNFAKLANEAYKNDNPTGTLFPYTDEAIEAYRTGSDPYKYPNVDWMEEMLKPSAMTRADFNISGGAKMVKYFVNAGYTQQNGLYKGEKNDQYDSNLDYKRYNFRSNIDLDFDEDFSVGLSLFGSIEDRNAPNTPTQDIFNYLVKLPLNIFPIQYPIGNYAGSGRGNPFALVNGSGYTQSYNSSLSGMLTATRRLDQITKGLYVKGNYSFDGYFRNNFSRTKEVRFAMYNGSGDLKDPANYTFVGQDVPLRAPTSSFGQNRSTWLDLSLNYERSFGEHTVTGLVLANRQQRVIGGDIPYVSQGIASRLTYNFRNRYFAELNAGYNGTDNFSKEQRYGFFPAVSAGWVISDEAFLKNNPVVNYLKLRGSYGLTGNDQLNGGRRWLFVSEYASGSGYSWGDPLTAIGGKQEGALANPGVTWEKARKLNVGVETKFFRDAFSLTVDFFREKRNDILITRGTVSGIVGVSAGNLPPENIGVVVNRGLELEAQYRGKVGTVQYFVRGNGSFARNKVLFKDEVEYPDAYLRNTGQRLGQLYGLTAIGFFNSVEEIQNSPRQFGNVIPGDIRYKDLNSDGVIDANDEGPIGKSLVPEILYGVSAGFSWKNLDFSVLFQGASNSSVYFTHEAAWEFYNGGSAMERHLNRWTPATAATATYPVLHYGLNANNHREKSSFFLRDASYLRFKNIELGYTFKQVKLGKRRSLDGLRLFANGINLITWDHMDDFGFDPEAPSGKGFFYPQLRVINAGFNATF